MIEPRFVAALLTGVVLALPYIAFCRRAARPEVPLALGLAVAALIYLVLAGLRGGTAGELRWELGGVVLFSVTAWVGVRWWPAVLAAGWAGHVAWDLLLHPVEVSGYAPWWYPVACIGFDLLVAGWVLGWLGRGGGFPGTPARRLSGS